MDALRSRLALSVAAAVALSGCGPGRAASGKPSGDDGIPPGAWPQYRRDLAGCSFAADGLRASDAPNLRESWRTKAGASTYAQAIVSDGVAFLTTTVVGSVVALDVQSGAVRWSRDFDATTTAACEGAPQHPGTWGSAAVADGVVYAASPDGNLYALDASTGAVRWTAKVADPSPHGELVQGSVIVSRALGRAYVGVASTAHCDQIPGRVAAVDLATHAVVARTLVPEGRRGAAVWSTVAIDEAAGRIYVSTGNAIGDAGSEPYAQAIVALDARTLAPVDAWQNPTTLENADFGSSPTLFSAGGHALLAATSKDGWLYVLDRGRLAAGPVWKRELAVTAGDGKGGDPLAGLGSIASATFANGVLYVAGGRTPEGEPGAVLALDPATGGVAWRHATPGPVLQPVAATDGVVVAVTAFTDAASLWDGRGHAVLEILDAHTGAVLASRDAAEGSLSAASFGGGKLLWPTLDGRVRALAP